MMWRSAIKYGVMLFLGVAVVYLLMMYKGI